jgi:hypothetical protein
MYMQGLRTSTTATPTWIWFKRFVKRQMDG